MLAPGWGTGTRGGSPPTVKLGSLPVFTTYPYSNNPEVIKHTLVKIIYNNPSEVGLKRKVTIKIYPDLGSSI